MEEQLFEQTEQQTQPVTTEKDLGVSKSEVSLGKFKDAQALLSAYNSLQAEFTKRCQRIKELEGVMAKFDKAENVSTLADANNKTVAENVSTDTAENVEQSTAPDKAIIGEILSSNDKGITDKLKEQVLKDYLKSVIEGKPQAIIMDGLGTVLKTISKRPTTFQEAGDFAVELLKK